MANPNLLRVCMSAALITLAVLNPVWADDTEIFFGNSTAYKPNVLFILDGSGSMNKYDCANGGDSETPCGDGSPTGDSTRLERMSDALLQILDTTQDINVGLMRFSHPDSGGRVLFPIMDIEQEVCGFGPCMSVREHLKRHISQIVASGATPTVGALIEAYNYFTGKPVNYGKDRVHGSDSSRTRNSRVSHPLSYTGGTHHVPGGCDPVNDPNDGDCTEEEITGNPVYVSPIQHECQANHIILVTDGNPSGAPPVAEAQLITGGSCIFPHAVAAGMCGAELTNHMATTDITAAFPGGQNITTHTIGFKFQSPWLETLSDVNEEGFDPGGDYNASSTDDLVRTISTIFGGAAKTGTTFVAPSVTIDQFSRLSHRKELYLALFKPQATTRWKGNLKKYNLAGSIATLKDAVGNAAVDATTGTFNPESRSFWSSAADGGDVILGGAAEHLNPGDRNIVSYLDTGNPNLLSDGNYIEPDNVTAEMLGVGSGAERNTLIDWLAGFDALDEDGDGDVVEARNHIGDPLHSSPVVVAYDFEDGQVEDENNLNSLVFFGTNEGFLHAIDSNDGTEEYAFMPRELMPNVAELAANRPLNGITPKIYGLDGDLTLRTIDQDNDGLIDQGDKAYLYVGMRRGGNNYYALDVSEKSQPKFLWNIIGGEGDYAELGQSWSKPEVARIKVGNEIKDVLVFGGGYDPQQDDYETRTADTVGRAIYIVDADTGDLIWSGGNPATQPTSGNNHQPLPDMRYSIPSDLALVPDMQTGLISQIYVGDMGGQLWRFDIDNGSSVADLVDGGVIADFADNTTADTRRFYGKPDLSLSRVDNELVINIGIGSGYRAHPLDESTEDMFFLYRYPYRGHPGSNYGVQRPGGGYTAAKLDDLFDTTNNLIVEGNPNQINQAEQQLALKEGWRIDLEDNGEKVLSHASTINGVVRFVSYVPTRATDICAPSLGTSFFYAVNLDNGSPYFDNEDEDGSGRQSRRSEIPGEGIAPPISTIFVEHDGAVTPTDVSGLNTLGEWDEIDMVRRWFWAENPEDY